MDRSGIERAKRGCRFYRFIFNFSMVDPRNVSVGTPRRDGNFFIPSSSNPFPYLIGTSIDPELNGLSGDVGFTGVFFTFLWWIWKSKYLFAVTRRKCFVPFGSNILPYLKGTSIYWYLHQGPVPFPTGWTRNSLGKRVRQPDGVVSRSQEGLVVVLVAT
jgi:hypothetical protein